LYDAAKALLNGVKALATSDELKAKVEKVANMYKLLSQYEIVHKPIVEWGDIENMASRGSLVPALAKNMLRDVTEHVDKERLELNFETSLSSQLSAKHIPAILKHLYNATFNEGIPPVCFDVIISRPKPTKKNEEVSITEKKLVEEITRMHERLKNIERPLAELHKWRNDRLSYAKSFVSEERDRELVKLYATYVKTTLGLTIEMANTVKLTDLKTNQETNPATTSPWREIRSMLSDLNKFNGLKERYDEAIKDYKQAKSNDNSLFRLMILATNCFKSIDELSKKLEAY
jgi:hypothetical protein